ncbi:hypothetical protein EK21DRAFT_108867 [Setomelanomma holmii]|uniref:Enoyl reductase (ER) domain-containing protein n=1 Tax=Setomelanomma holmii TaxID=210430 RepID=A0A9P4HGY2_9PLEO|nr:hypothetical protein EK21DRAFT_108867 [Setomelanomma holmii]
MSRAHPAHWPITSLSIALPFLQKPDTIGLPEATGLGIAGATALELIKAANLKRGYAVLLNGAGGGIGHLALQMCLEKVGETGRVVAICSGRSMEWLRKLTTPDDSQTGGGRCKIELIDREAQPLVPHLIRELSEERFDVAIDAVGIQETAELHVLEHARHVVYNGKELLVAANTWWHA